MSAGWKRIIKNFLSSRGGEGRYVFNPSLDGLIESLGYSARQILESVAPEQRKRVLYFIGYHHSKFLAVIDAVNILALQVRGAEVFTVRSSFFYENEDVIYGGAYNADRFNKHSALSQHEALLLSILLQTKCVFLDAFVNRDEVASARQFADNCQPELWPTLRYEGIPIGEMAAYCVANLNDEPYMRNIESHYKQYKEHIKNCIKLYFASRRLLTTLSPDVIVSNIPFYYQWKIPFYNAAKMSIPFYSYSLGEKKDSLFWTNESTSFYDSTACWDSFCKSDMLEDYETIVNNGIDDRFHGNISNHNYAPDAENTPPRVASIREWCKGRPTVLFPCNVLVDAAVLMKAPAFPSCLEMIRRVIDWFAAHPGYCCLLKAHPAEKLWLQVGSDSAMCLRTILHREKISLPDNVIFIDYNEDVSVYSLFEIVKGVIAYSSSVCLDAGLCGKPSISAVRAHYCVAGFTQVPLLISDFFRQVKYMLTGPAETEKIIKMAKIYYLLYYYFGSVDFKLYSGNDSGSIPTALHFNSITKIMPGENASLDYICDAILNNKPIFSENRWPPLNV